MLATKSRKMVRVLLVTMVLNKPIIIAQVCSLLRMIGNLDHKFFSKFRSLQNFMMDFHKFEGPSDHQNMRNDIVNSMNKFGVDLETIENMVTYTTDKGSALVKSLEIFERIDDILHQMNTLAKRCTSPYAKNFLPTQYEISDKVRNQLTEIHRIVKNCKKLIAAVW